MQKESMDAIPLPSPCKTMRFFYHHDKDAQWRTATEQRSPDKGRKRSGEEQH
jgi:hypothetical protein